MMKRLLAVLLAVAMPFSLVGCGAKPSDNNKGTAEGQKIVLDFPSWETEAPGSGDWWKALVTEFEAEHSNVTINHTQVPFKNFVDTLTTRFAANTPPDIVHLPARNFAQFADQGWLAPMDDLLQQSDIPANWPEMQKTAMTWNGKTEGVLLLEYGYVMFYNEKMFQDAGVKVPTTPGELLTAAKALTKGDVFGFGATTTEHPNIYPDVSEFVVGEGAGWTKDGKYNLADPAVVKAVDDYRQVLKYSPKGLSTEQKRQLFFDGKIAMIIDGPFVLASKSKAADAVKPHVKVALAPFPYVPGGASNGLHIPASLTGEKKQLVWEFIQLAASPEWQQKYSELVKAPAPRTGSVTADTQTKIPEMAVFSQGAAKAMDVIPPINGIKANYDQYAKLISASMMKLITTNEPTAKVLQDLQNQLNSAIPLK